MRGYDTRGFTLVEMLVSLVILSFLAAIIETTFFQGVKLWQRGMREYPERKTDIFFEKVLTELRGSIVYQNPPLQGASNFVEFYTLEPDLKRNVKTPTRIRYFFDPPSDTILREREKYEEILYLNRKGGKGRVVLDGVTHFKLEYYTFDTKRNSPIWRKNWSEPCMPEAIKFNLEYEGSKKTRVARTFKIPKSYRCRPEK